MGYRELLPPPALRPYVDRFWLRAPTVGRVSAARIVPDGCIDVLIDADSGAARVVGTMTEAVVHDARTSRLAAVRFRPGGAHPFLRVGSAELTDQVLEVAALGARWLEVGAGEPTRLVAALTRALLARDARPVDLRVRAASRRLLSARPPRVAELARELGLSRQQLGRLFREHVGLAPKELARIARLQRALDRLRLGPALSLAAAAVELGYYDQAHMTADFRELAGITPAAARRAGRSIFPIRSLWLEA
jgi:AraC-like DNA-binding protein